MENQLWSTHLLWLEFHFLNRGITFSFQRKIVCKCSTGICPLKPGFHMIGTIAVIAAIAKTKRFSDRSDHSDHMETTLQRSLNLFFSAIAVIVAIIWKPGFIVTNRWKDLQQASRETGRFTRRIGPRRLFTLGYMGLEPTTTLRAEAYLAFFVEFFAANAWLRRAIQPIISRFIESANKRRPICLSYYLCPWILYLLP